MPTDLVFPSFSSPCRFAKVEPEGIVSAEVFHHSRSPEEFAEDLALPASKGPQIVYARCTEQQIYSQLSNENQAAQLIVKIGRR